MRKQYIQPIVIIYKLQVEAPILSVTRGNVKVNNFSDEETEQRAEEYGLDPILKPGDGSDFN